MDLNYIDPQARVLNYCYKWFQQLSFIQGVLQAEPVKIVCEMPFWQCAFFLATWKQPVELNRLREKKSAKASRSRTLAVHESVSSVMILILEGSRSTITEIT